MSDVDRVALARTPERFFAVLVVLALAVSALPGAAGCVGEHGGSTSIDSGLGSADTLEPPLSDEDGGVRGPGVRSEAEYGDGVAGGACFNLRDDDGNGLSDCADPSCAGPTANRACCVASTAGACCAARAMHALTPILDSPGCSSASPCLGVDGTPAVPVRGVIYEGTSLASGCSSERDLVFAPIGDATAHGHLALPTAYDPAASYLRVEGRIGIVQGADARVAAAGFGLFVPGGLAHQARPLVAVVASAASNDLRIIVGDRVVATEPLPSGGEPCDRVADYALDLHPDGAFEVERRAVGGSTWTSVFIGGGYDVVRDARVAIFGQQPNPTSDGPKAWVGGVSVEVKGCDVLAPARSAEPAASTPSRAHDVTGISVFPTDGSRTRFEALVTSGEQLYWMEASASGRLGVAGSTDAFARNIQPSYGEYTRFEDVEVLFDETTHHVFLAAARADGAFEVIRTRYTPSPTPGMPGTLDEAHSVIASAADFGAGAISVDGPTALRRRGSSGIVVVVRVRYGDGRTELRVAPVSAAALADGLPVETPPVVALDPHGITTNGLIRGNAFNDVAAFDRDEVADPHLFEVDGIVRVLYAGRRGTRWSIGMVVASPDFTHFAPAGGAPVLGPSGSGFDALGVTEPFLLQRGGVDFLFYAGSDGIRRSIGVASQPVVPRTP